VQEVKFERSAFASRSHAQGLTARLLHQDHVRITADQLGLVYFHKNEVDEMTCELKRS